MELSYPYRLYPLSSRNILTDYISSYYKSEIIDLYNKLDDLNKDYKNNKPLIILIIGSLIDDNTEHRYSVEHQYQHLPKFIHNYMLNNDNPIKILCVSPGNGKDTKTSSRFIKLTQDAYEWSRKNKHDYKSKKYPRLTYSFYNTLFPEFIETDFVKIRNKYVYLYDNQITTYRIPKLYYRNKNFQDLYDIQIETNTRIYLKFKKDDHNMQFNYMCNKLPSDYDLLFVNNFNTRLTDLTNNLKYHSGSLLILNYAVFHENWAMVPSSYFCQTMYDNFTKSNWQNVKILSYSFERDSSILYDINKKTYSYEDSTLEMAIAENSQIEINDKKNEYIDCEDKIIINGMNFKIIKVHPDGDCMFNAVFKQFDNLQITIKDVRKLIISQILICDNVQNLLKEELNTRLEYNDLIQNKGIDYVFDIHIYFMKEGPKCDNAEIIRNIYKLPLDVYYGSNYELSILSKLLKVNIRIININNKIIDILSLNTDYKDIYIKFNENHYDMAKLQYHSNIQSHNIEIHLQSNAMHKYNTRVHKFITYDY